MIIDSRNGPLDPRDTAWVRRELVEFLRDKGEYFYETQIVQGHQLLLPPTQTVEQAAERLARDEITRLDHKKLYFWSEEMCALLAASFPTMPAFLPRPFDLPSQCGFCLFAVPVATAKGENAQYLERYGDPAYANDDDPEIHAVAWGPIPEDMPLWTPQRTQPWRYGATWFSFYATHRLYRFEAQVQETLRRYMGPLGQDNECLVPWPGPDTAEDDPYYLLDQVDSDEDGTGVWARMVFAAFILLKQTKLVDVERVRADRPERRRSERADLPVDEDIAVVRLRSAQRRTEPSSADQDTAAADGSGRKYDQWRWPVGPFWRNQWYPKEGVHRPRLIEQFWKGRDDAPVKPGTVVKLVTPPRHAHKTPEEKK